jgi:CheY-like chemotaxis protein
MPDDLARTEARRLAERASWEEIEISRLLDELRPVVETLARAKTARVCIEPVEGLSLPQGDRVMVRQALLSAVTHALDAAPECVLTIGVRDGDGERGILLRVEGVPQETEPSLKMQASSQAFEVCRQLMDSLGGDARCVEADANTWEIYLAWRLHAPRTLLAVDDNEGLIDLFRRYLSGHGWQVVAAPSASEARRLLAEATPTAIALDVMMPGEDGWDLLTSLKADPATRGIPVIVCSVLRQPELARSLGAAAFLPKPVSQQDLLGALAPWR